MLRWKWIEGTWHAVQVVRVGGTRIDPSVVRVLLEVVCALPGNPPATGTRKSMPPNSPCKDCVEILEIKDSQWQYLFYGHLAHAKIPSQTISLCGLETKDPWDWCGLGGYKEKEKVKNLRHCPRCTRHLNNL